MATFIHLCHEADLKRIKRSGLKDRKQRRGVYAMPATPHFYLSHICASPGMHLSCSVIISGLTRKVRPTRPLPPSCTAT